MTVDPATSKHQFDHHGKTFGFCSAGCRTKSRPDPTPSSRKTASQGRRARRRHLHLPDASRDPPSRPRELPDLRHGARTGGREPRDAAQSRAGRHDAAVLDRARLTLPAVVLAMGGHLVGGHRWVDPTLSNWIQFAFATPVVLWAGWPFFLRGWQSLVKRNLNMFTLIALGTGVAYVYSVVGTVAPGIFPRPSAATAARSPSTSSPPRSSPCWCCSARCSSCAPARRPRAPSRRCSSSRPRPPAGSATMAPTRGRDRQLAVGDRLRVRPGEKVPVDGVILEGRSRSMSRW